MKLYCLLTIFLFSIWHNSANAQIFADLNLTVRIEPPYPWIPGTEGR